MNITHVQIQTVDKCNAACTSCPHRLVYHSDDIMRKNIFIKFIDNLAIVADPYEIEISLHLENEPLLDPYLFERAKYIKEKIPQSIIIFVTNGMLLHKYIEDIKTSINKIMVSLDGYNAETYNLVHSTNISDKDWEKMIDAYYDLKKANVNIVRNKYIHLNDETPNEFLKRYFNSKTVNYTRGGILNHVSRIQHNEIKGCKKDIPHNWINILADGSLILCCMDYTKSIVLGHIQHQTLEEIFNSKLYKTVIDKVNGVIESSNDFICKNCELSIPKEII